MPVEVAPCGETYKSALKAFVVVNLILLVSGPIIICAVFALNNRHGKVEQIVSSYTEDTQVPANLMHFSAFLTSVNGVLGLISAYFDVPLLFDSHEGFTFISLGLNLIAAVAASLVPTRPSKDNYENLFQAETYHLLQHQKFSSICRGQHTWNNVQEVIGCCGVLGPRDWLLSALNTLPASCCNSHSPTGFKKCGELSEESKRWTRSDSFQRIHNEIFPLLWNRNCLDTFRDLLARRKFVFTIFPLCLLLLESFIMAYSALLVDFIRHYSDYMNRTRPDQPLRHILQKLQRQQADLKIIDSKSTMEVNLEETMELRKQSSSE